MSLKLSGAVHKDAPHLPLPYLVHNIHKVSYIPKVSFSFVFLIISDIYPVTYSGEKFNTGERWKWPELFPTVFWNVSGNSLIYEILFFIVWDVKNYNNFFSLSRKQNRTVRHEAKQVKLKQRYIKAEVLVDEHLDATYDQQKWTPLQSPSKHRVILRTKICVSIYFFSPLHEIFHWNVPYWVMININMYICLYYR